MKTSSLLGILAIGGIGYYLLKKQKKSSDILSDIDSETPIITTPTISPEEQKKIFEKANTAYQGGVTLTKDIVKEVVKLKEEAVAQIKDLNLEKEYLAWKANEIQQPVSIQSQQYKADKIEENCDLPSVGWDANIVENYIKSFNTLTTKLILNKDLKDVGSLYKDTCGNILMKPSTNAITAEALLKDDGFYGKTGFGSAVPNVNYYVKNKKVYLLPSKLIEEYRIKYLAPHELYLKNLPALDPSLATPAQFALYPPQGIWVNEPKYLYSSHPVGWFDKAMLKTPTSALDVSNADFKYLVLNPRVRNKNNFYVDQFGNINTIPTEFSSNGDSKAPFYEIAEYRIKNNITF